jgi:uncharacterized repeat protein (TIGR01451 family)
VDNSPKPRRLPIFPVQFAREGASGSRCVLAALARTSRAVVVALLVVFSFSLLVTTSRASAETTLSGAPSAIDIGTLPAPTIQSDKADYPPSATVRLTGTGWLASDAVKIFVNDDEGQSWSLTDYVSADAQGNITYDFTLPNWFVARYSVVTTGTASGLTATTTFTDSNFASLQGQSKGSTTWIAGNLSGWQELDPIPMRVLFDPASADVNNVSTITIDYDHTKTKGSSTYQGLDRPLGLAVAAGDTSKIQCLNCDNPVRSEPTGSDTWSVSFQVRPLVATPSSITFRTRLRAGAHYFTGSSLALSGNASPGSGLGILQVPKPAPKTGSPDLQLTKIGPSTAAPGSTISYTLNYSNSSTATGSATGIQLTDTLPSGVTYASGCVPPMCSVSADGRTLVWDLGDLAPGASGSVSFTATVSSDLAYGTTVTNNGEIDSAENDAAFTDNRGSASTEIQFNRAPSASSQNVSTDEDSTKTITLSGSDPDGNALGYKITSLPASGSLYDGTSVFATRITSVGTTGYALSGNQVTYLPNLNYNGSDSFGFKSNDGSLDSPAAATVSLTITPVNDAPTASATPQSPSLPEDGQVTVALSGTDVETAAADLQFKITELPAHGTLSKDGTALALGDSFTGSPADVVYQPDPDYNGSDGFKFELSDRGDPDNCGTPGAGCAAAKSDQQTVSLTITPVNDAPTASATPQSPSLPEDGQVTVALSGTDVETAAADLQFKITELPAHGTLSKDGTALALGDSFTGSPADVVYQPDPDYNGSDGFKFETNDGSLDSHEQTVSLTITPVNDAPTANDNHSTTIAQDTSGTTFDLRALVSDVETSKSNLTYTIVSGPSHGTLEAVSGASGTFSYQPDAGYSGSDSFTYKVTDRGDPDNCSGAPSVSCTSPLDSDVRTVPITIIGRPLPSPSLQQALQPPTARPASRRIETVPIDQLAKLPRCASRRRFRIRLRRPHGERLSSAVVFVNGRQVKVVKGRRLTSPVDLRGLPKGRFKVKILVTTASGRQFAGTRRYRTCTPRQAGGKHKRPPRL